MSATHVASFETSSEGSHRWVGRRIGLLLGCAALLALASVPTVLGVLLVMRPDLLLAH